MKIKLIQPKMSKRPMDTSLKARMSPPLALYTIASILRAEHEVIIENENIESINFEEGVDLVGISVTVDVFPRAIEIAKAFKTMGIPVIVGGIHISSDPEGCSQVFDSICIGPSENLWSYILEDLNNGQLKKRYQDDGSFNSDSFVSPAYDLMKKDRYLFSNIIYTSYGCPFRCDFCYNSVATYRNIYVHKSVDMVIGEIKAIGRKHIMIVDDNFIGDPAWTLEFLDKVRPLRIKWNAAVSANIVNMPVLLDSMADSGCQGLFIGFESLSQAVVSEVNKGQNVISKYEKLVAEVHKRGMMVNASFVFGLDGDDQGVFRRTVDWLVKNRIETVTSHILTPYPGTCLYDRWKKERRIISDDLSLYSTAKVVIAPADMSSRELYEGYMWVYRELYSFKNIIKRIPLSRKQIIPYFMFNFFYRKFGWLTEGVAKVVNFERVGRFAEWVSRYMVSKES